MSTDQSHHQGLMEKTTQDKSHWEQDGSFCDAGPYRAYHCGCCQKLCKVCSSCDRGNIYCHDCAPEMRARRERKADKRYRATSQGKNKRSLQSQRRYSRRSRDSIRPTTSQTLPLTLLTQAHYQEPGSSNTAISEPEKNVLGDRGSPSEQSLGCATTSALESTEGKTNEEAIRNLSLVAKQSGELKAVRANVFCEFCGGRCSEFRRRLGRSRMDRRRLQSAKTPRDGPCSYGGEKL